MGSDCPEGSRVCQNYHQAIEVIGRRWTGAILYVLCQGPSRFCELREAIPEISDRLLTERLKELEEVGIVVREVGSGRPVQVLYRLTPKGEALQPVLNSIHEWANQWSTAPTSAEASVS